MDAACTYISIHIISSKVTQANFMSHQRTSLGHLQIMNNSIRAIKNGLNKYMQKHKQIQIHTHSTTMIKNEKVFKNESGQNNMPLPVQALLQPSLKCELTNWNQY